MAAMEELQKFEEKHANVMRTAMSKIDRIVKGQKPQ